MEKTARPFLFWYQKMKVDEEEQEEEVDGPGAKRTTKHPFFHPVIVSRQNTRDQLAGDESVHVFRKIVTLDISQLRSRRSLGSRDGLRLSDMCVYFYDKDAFRSALHLRSMSYLWMTILMGIFYTLPVFQLVLHYQETSVNSGNLDICYYNYDCLYHYLFLEDFGHVFSNVSYMICGAFFLVVAFHRSWKNKAVCREGRGMDRTDPLHPENCGIPEQYGIYYAMGSSLIMEGLLSGCYHICPTARNFQFDTTFMYAIAVLIFLKVYQFRHPDITYTAHLVFLVFGLILVLEVVGYFTNHVIFWIIFVVVYMVILLVFLLYIYNNGTCSIISLRSLARLKPSQICQKLKEIRFRELIPSLTVILVNVILAGFFLWTQKPGVSRYLLVIMMLNMLLYVLYYIFNKLYYRFRSELWIWTEQVRVTTVVYGLLAAGFGVAAFLFFRTELKNSSVSPALSRNLNAPCFLGIFDNHDMWHFLSAVGLFFSFMFILTLEDLNIAVPRNKILVF